MQDNHQDFKELLELFDKHKVRYCIIGAFAVGYHGAPRYTKDLDILVDPYKENAQAILSALNDFGFGTLDLNISDFSEVGQIIQLGYEPNRIDLLTTLSPEAFSQLWEHRERGAFGEIEANFVGLEDLLQLKQKAGRSQDKSDIETLKRIHAKKTGHS